MSGVRAEIEVSEPGNCPVAAVSAGTDGAVGSVSWSGTEGGVTEEFAVGGTRRSDPQVDELTDDETSVEPVFDYGSETVYQFQRADSDCVCELVESLDCPVADVRGDGGSLLLTLHLDEMDDLRTVVAELKTAFGGVAVRYLAQMSADGDGERDLVPVDRGRLTERQAEVLSTAYEMGYFEYPRDSNATEVAAELGIRPSTFTEHLSAAQSKLLEDLVGE
jgi:hypothetical protein